MDLSQALANTLNADGNLRNTAEQALAGREQTNFRQFAQELASELANEQATAEVRMQAGTQLKNLLTAKDSDLKLQKAQRWMMEPEALRTIVKDTVCRTFTSGVKQARRSAASAAAAIAAIELPQNQWLGLLGAPEAPAGSGQLVQAVTCGGSPEQAEASLETLGLICADCEAGDYLESRSNDILTAVVSGMQSAVPSVKLAATVAMENSLEFVEKNMTNEGERNMLMTQILTGCTTNTGAATDLDVRERAMMCLVKIAEKYYDHLPAYLEAIFGVVTYAIKADDERVGQQGLEFFSSVCEEEAERIYAAEQAQEEGEEEPAEKSLGLASGVVAMLVPVILEALTKQEDDQTNEDWNLSQAAAITLTLCAQTVREMIVPLVLPFMQSNFENPDWHYREAALMTLGCILEGPEGDDMKALVSQVIPPVVQKLGDAEVVCRDTAAWALGKVSEHHADCLENDAVMQPYAEALVNSLTDEPRVAYQAAYALHNLGEAWMDDERFETTNPFSKFFQPIVTALLQATDRPDAGEANLRTATYEAIATLIMHAPEDVHPLVAQLLSPMLERLAQSFQQGLDPNALADLQGTLCGILANILSDGKISKENMMAAQGEQLSPADSVMQALIAVAQPTNGSGNQTEEALMCASAVAEAVEEHFERYAPQFMPIMQAGLKNHSEVGVFTAAVGAVGDVCRALEHRVEPHCDMMVTELLQALQAPTLDRDVKPTVFGVMGDIAMALGSEFEKYVEICMTMLMQASSTPVPDTDDYDEIDNVYDLRENVLDAVTGILQGCKSSPTLPQTMDKFLRHLLDFIVAITRDEDSPESLIKAATGVVGDLCFPFSTLKPKVLPVILSQQYQPDIQKLCQRCMQSEDEVTKETGQYTMSNLS